MSDETLLETLKKASSAIYIVTDEETANHISILFRRAGSEIATLQSELAAAREELARARGMLPVQNVFAHIKHGDADHQAWLLAKLQEIAHKGEED